MLFLFKLRFKLRLVIDTWTLLESSAHLNGLPCSAFRLSSCQRNRVVRVAFISSLKRYDTWRAAFLPLSKVLVCLQQMYGIMILLQSNQFRLVAFF